MYAITISDEELLPIGEQIQLLENASREDVDLDKCRSLQKRLDREFNRHCVDFMEYIRLSKKIIGQKSLLQH